MSSDDPITLGEIARTLQRMEHRLAEVTSDHEKRLRSVERWVYAVPPTLILAAASILTAIASR